LKKEIKKIKHLISNNDLLNTFDILLEITKETGHFNSAVQFKKRYVELQQNQNSGLLSFEESSRISNTITHGLLKLLDKLDEPNINETETIYLNFDEYLRIKNEELEIKTYLLEINQIIKKNISPKIIVSFAFEERLKAKMIEIENSDKDKIEKRNYKVRIKNILPLFVELKNNIVDKICLFFSVEIGAPHWYELDEYSMEIFKIIIYNEQNIYFKRLIKLINKNNLLKEWIEFMDKPTLITEFKKNSDNKNYLKGTTKIVLYNANRNLKLDYSIRITDEELEMIDKDVKNELRFEFSHNVTSLPHEVVINKVVPACIDEICYSRKAKEALSKDSWVFSLSKYYIGMG